MHASQRQMNAMEIRQHFEDVKQKQKQEKTLKEQQTKIGYIDRVKQEKFVKLTNDQKIKALEE